nr:P27 family phage terminase small subunit [Ensifer sp. ENS07]
MRRDRAVASNALNCSFSNFWGYDFGPAKWSCPAVTRIKPPADLAANLHGEFHRLVLQLGALASAVDPAMLGRLVKARAEETAISARIDREGQTIMGVRGLTKHPLLPQLSRVRQQITKLESATGIDLNSRRRITGKVIRPDGEGSESDQDFLMRLLMAGREPDAEDMARLEAIAAAKRKSKPARRPRTRH